MIRTVHLTVEDNIFRFSIPSTLHRQLRSRRLRFMKLTLIFTVLRIFFSIDFARRTSNSQCLNHASPKFTCESLYLYNHAAYLTMPPMYCGSMLYLA